MTTDEYNELYQEILLDHNRNPRNFRKMEQPTCSADGMNPLCGDNIHLYLKLDGDRIEDISFEGSGCAISKASASMLGLAVKGKTTAEALKLFDQFHAMVTAETPPDSDSEELGDLIALQGVRAFPVRIKCAILAWHALQAALRGEHGVVSTE